MKENYPNYYPNQEQEGNFLQTLNPQNESEEQFLLQNLISLADNSPSDQPVLNPEFFSLQENNDQSMYIQQPPMVQYTSTLNTPVYEATEGSVRYKLETPSPLSYSEENVNLHEIKEEQNLNCLNANPLFVLSIIPWPGPFDFRITIPSPNLQGVKPKWCFSEVLNKLYVARNVAFPINITLDNYPVGALLNICPVFTKSSNRMIPVTRCPNCQMTDKEIESRDHVIKVEGPSSYYFYQNDRHMVSIPLGQPAPGDDMLNAFLKVACNTSCVGGPNRKPFSILITLKLGESEIGRQVIDVKCCEGPLRDMATEEKREQMTNVTENKEDMKRVIEVANDVANIKKAKTTKKRKLPDTKLVESRDNSEEYVTISLRVPKKYVKKTKRYLNQLYIKDQVKELKEKEKNLKYLFPSAMSESD